MESHITSLLTCAYFCHGKSIEELKHLLLRTTMELEQTRTAAQEELKKRDDQLAQLREFLGKAIRERDEAREKWQRALLENIVLLHQNHHHHRSNNAPNLSGISGVEDEPRRGIESMNNGISSSSEESIVSSSPVLAPPAPAEAGEEEEEEEVVIPEPEKPLPEKGKLLQAVMKAGPLLQTLLLAGPLPQWRHPPPPLGSFEIPPVTIPSPPDRFCSRKRVVPDGGFSDSPTETKLHRVVLH